MTQPNQLYQAAADVEAFVREQGWSHCFIGGLAVLCWSEPRQTTDIDLCVFTDFGFEEAVVDLLLQRYAKRYPDGREFALTRRVALLRCANNVPCDISLGALPFEHEMISRARPFEVLPGYKLRMCSAEDLVVTKAFAGRPHDWRDVEGTLTRQRGKLDLSYIRRWLGELAELAELHDRMELLERLLARHRNPQ